MVSVVKTVSSSRMMLSVGFVLRAGGAAVRRNRTSVQRRSRLAGLAQHYRVAHAFEQSVNRPGMFCQRLENRTLRRTAVLANLVGRDFHVAPERGNRARRVRVRIREERRRRGLGLAIHGL